MEIPRFHPTHSKVASSIKIIFRRGIPYPPVVIQGVLINHYLREKEICSRIRELDGHNPLRKKLLVEVYEIAHAAYKKYVEAGFLQPDTTLFYESITLFAKNVDKLFANKGTMLDLGCGRGYLLLAMQKLGWNCKGVDIHTNQVLKEVKNEVESADILFYRDDQRYDLIVMDQVLEHIQKRDCIYVLKKVYNLLKNGGYFVLRGPNRLNGPHDVSRWFISLGSKAEGTHFNEMTVTETIFKMRRIGFRNFKTPIIPFTPKLPSQLRFFFFWTKNRIPLAILFEKIYSFIPYELKPISSFSFFVPNTIAAQK